MHKKYSNALKEEVAAAAIFCRSICISNNLNIDREEIQKWKKNLIIKLIDKYFPPPNAEIKKRLQNLYKDVTNRHRKAIKEIFGVKSDDPF